MRSTDFDAYAMTHHRVAVVSASASGTTTQQFGRNTAPTTIVLIHVNVHYRVLIHVDGTRTFRADTIADALEFARAHATAWYATGAAAPPFPDASAADRKAAAAPAVPPAKPDKPAKAAAQHAPPTSGPPGGAEWKTQTAKMQYAEAVSAARAITIDAGPAVTDINAIAQRLTAADITLSAFARKWTIAQDKSVQVEALSPELYNALLAFAPAVRRATRTDGLINITPARKHAAAVVAVTPSRPPVAPDTRGKPRARGRTRGGPRRGRAPTGTAAPKHGSGRGGNAAAAAAGPDPLMTLIQQQMQQQQQLLSLVLQHRTRSPHQPRTRYCRDCGQPEHRGRCAESGADDADGDDDVGPAPPRPRSRTRGHGSGSDEQGGRSKQGRSRSRSPQ
jgi:hypothetical protein